MAKTDTSTSSPAKRTKPPLSDVEVSPSVRVRDAIREIKLEDSPWKLKTGSVPGWITRGMPRPEMKRGLPKIIRALGSLYIYPSQDPYKPKQRALFRLLMNECSWIHRANVVIQKLTVTKSTTEIEPRKEQELNEDILLKWRETEIQIPYLKKKMKPKDLKQWIDRLYHRLDAPSVFFNAYLIMREQGRCLVGMFPETRDEESKKWTIPRALRYIEPEFTRRPLLNFNTAELEAVEVIGLNSDGGKLDAHRSIYMTNADNLNLFSRYYGKSQVEPLADMGKTLLTIYSQDFLHAAEYTWHKPNIYRITIPARDYDHVDQVQDEFNRKLSNNAGKDISVTQAVELLNPGAGSNSGNITGLIDIQNQCIEGIGGYYNIPPFLFGKGKAGRLGGNANKEEIDSFLEIEIRPEQEMLEAIIENQFYDRILAILFDIEPDEVDNPEKCPIKIKHYFDKPDISSVIDPDQYNIYMDLWRQKFIKTEDLMDRLNIRSDLKDDSMTTGGDSTPTINTWERSNPSWEKQKAPSWAPKEWNSQNGNWIQSGKNKPLTWGDIPEEDKARWASIKRTAT